MRLQKIISSATISLFISCNVHAAEITNQIDGVGPKDNMIFPIICIQNGDGAVTSVLSHAETVDGNKASSSPYYVGATLRFGGCGSNNTYLGYVGFSVNDQHNNKFSTYTPPEGIHISYQLPSIDRNGIITGKINYTPIQPNFKLLSQEPSKNNLWNYVGINLSGLEFGKVIDPVVIPNLSAEDAAAKFSDLAEVRSFVKAGMNTVRLPISWGYLQLEGPGKGELNLDYFNSYIKPALETLTTAHVQTIVDLHAYMRYSIFGKEYSGCGPEGKCPDGTLITDSNIYQDVWSKILKLIKQDDKIDLNYISFDLMNEPVDVPNDLVASIQMEVIKTLRNQGFTGTILVEGNAWSGLHSWTTTRWTSADGKQTYTNAELFSRDNFVKHGVTDLSNIIINVHQYFDSDYSGTHDQCLRDLNTSGISGFNLNAFVDYLRQNKIKAMVTEFGTGRDSNSCSAALDSFLIYLKDNAFSKNKDYGFVGWTIWSSGHGWGDYNLRVTPASYQMQILQNYLNH